MKQLDENIAKVKNQINNIYTFEQLEKDTGGILEKYAREQLNLQRPNEDVYVIVYE
jgi:cell division protein FtsB